LPEITTLFWDIGGGHYDQRMGHGRAAAGSGKRFIWIGKSFRTGTTCRFPAFDSGLISLGRIPEPDIVLPTAVVHARGIRRVHVLRNRRSIRNRGPVLDKLARKEKYFIGSINNEPLELNEYRIKAFHLRRDFQAFFQLMLFAHAKSLRR